MAKVWVAQLERFGYTLLCVEKTKQKAVDAMSREYIKTYFNWNKHDGNLSGYETAEDMVANDEEFKEYYKCAMDEMFVTDLEYGEVDWR